MGLGRRDGVEQELSRQTASQELGRQTASQALGRRGVRQALGQLEAVRAFRRPAMTRYPGTRPLVRPPAWVARDGFDELAVRARFPTEIAWFNGGRCGRRYVLGVRRRTRMGSEATFDLSRVSADGRNNWTQRIEGESYSLTVDAAGTVYQSRKLNGVGVLDKRAADGRWLWSNEIEAMTLHLGGDGALYGAAWGERLRKFDDDGNVLWTWQGPGQRGVSGFGADASGTVFVRTGVTPSAQLPSGAKGQSAPRTACSSPWIRAAWSSPNAVTRPASTSQCLR